MKRWQRWFAAAAGVMILAAAAGCGGAATQTGGKIKLLETGSTLLYPLFNIWVPAYQRLQPQVQITTAGTGSGEGIADAIAGTVQIGASDAYMSGPQVTQNPGLLNIPLAISAQQINYNLPGLNATHLKLSGPVLAGIYLGKIRHWDNPAIKGLNPGVKLPHHVIIPVHRADGSGDTFIFTQYLSFSDPAWQRQVGYGTTVGWPSVPGGVAMEGNPGMVQALESSPYTIAYVGISWLDRTDAAHLGYAYLENAAGNFVLPTRASIEAAAAAKVSQTPADERISLVFAPGKDSYPIINYEYAIVNRKQPDPRTAQALRAFLKWAVSPRGGSTAAFLDRVHFLPLPASVVKLSLDQIDQIGK